MWKLLKLPRLHSTTAVTRARLTEWLLQQYVEGGRTDRRGELEYFGTGGQCGTDELRCVSRLHSLTSLQLAPTTRVVDFAPLCAPLQAMASLASSAASATTSSRVRPSLPLPRLRHLCIRSTLDRTRPEVKAENELVVNHYLRLIHTYSASLLTLELHDILLVDSCTPILLSVLHCGHLRTCHLSSLSMYADALLPAETTLSADMLSAALPSPALPYLQSLFISIPVTVAELECVLPSCAALENFHLEPFRVRRPGARAADGTLNVYQHVQLAARLCPSVRRLTINDNSRDGEARQKKMSQRKRAALRSSLHPRQSLRHLPRRRAQMHPSTSRSSPPCRCPTSATRGPRPR